MVSDWTDPPWTIVFPGLSERRAHQIIQVLRENALDAGAWVDSPSDSIHLGLDRATAQTLRMALSSDDNQVVEPHLHDTEVQTPAEARSRLSAITSDLDDFLLSTAASNADST
jgi:hypothetical protein